MAQSDFFLNIKEAPGESTDSSHKGQIDILSFSMGVSNSGTMAHGGGGGAGKASFQDFSFSQNVDKACPKLMELCAAGTHIDKVELFARKQGGEQVEYIKYTLSTVLVSGFQLSGAGADVMASYTLNFGKIEMEYTEQDDKGGKKGQIKGGWDLKQNKKV